MAVSERDVRMVQVAYPQIYFACHTRHVRRASTPTRLSATDSTLRALEGIGLLAKGAQRAQGSRK
jgi:hypothetical protein